MGKISFETQQTQTPATHFSHPHPLNLINSDQIPNISPPCSGCKLKPSGMIYSCTVCNFFLHKKCFEMPKKITHPVHKEHALTLLPEPAYAEGIFNCDACRETGSGFSYHCKPCGIDLHILCAATPLSLTTAYHPHKLDLAFGSPYHTKDFACYICNGQGSDHWLYRCGSCGFDAHLKCATVAPPVQVAPPQQAPTCSRTIPMVQPQGPNGPHFMAAPPPHMQQNFMPRPMMNNAAVGFPTGGPVSAQFGANAQNEIFLQVLIQMVQNNSAMTQAILSGNLGGVGGGLGGGFGGDRGAQQLMQLMSGLNNSGLGGGGLGSLQSLLGGGGGFDFLGGGGLDFLGGLGGLF